MKDFWKSGVLILIVIGALYIIYLRECTNKKCIKDDEMVIKKSVWDSIIAISEKPPIVTKDTFYLRGKTQVVKKDSFIYMVLPDSTKEYTDSIKNKEIDIVWKSVIKGELINFTTNYTPIIKEVFVKEIQFVPKIVDKPYPVYTNGLFTYGLLGGNSNSFIFGGGIDYITKNGTEYGYLYQKFGSTGFHSFKLGVRLSRQ